MGWRSNWPHSLLLTLSGVSRSCANSLCRDRAYGEVNPVAFPSLHFGCISFSLARTPFGRLSSRNLNGILSSQNWDRSPAKPTNFCFHLCFVETAERLI